MKNTILILFFGFFTMNLQGQDLIERTRLQLKADQLAVPTLISKKVKSVAFFKEVEIFDLDETSERIKSNQDVIRLNIKENMYDQLSSVYGLILPIPVTKQSKVDLLLYRVRSSSTYFRVKDENGQPIERGAPTQFFRGVVKDDPGSLVAVSVFKHNIQVVISDSYGNYNLGKVKNSSGYAFFKEVDGQFEFTCGVDDINAIYDPDAIKESRPGEQPSQKSATDECVKVYIEADYETYQNFSSDDVQVMDFIEGMFNVVATIYDNESIPIELSELTIWHSNDPYGAESNVSGALQYLNANIGSFNGNLFHLVSAIGNNPPSGWAGIANIYCDDAQCNITKTTAMCNPDPFAVSQTTLFYEDLPNYSWSVNVFAHEMGHNMGSPHTHACQWGPNEDQAIDGCYTTEGGCTDPGYPPTGGGTIMSYCHFPGRPGITFANGFGQEVGDHIRGQYANVTCLTACSEPPPPPPPPPPACEDSIMVEMSPVDGNFEASELIQIDTTVNVLTLASFDAPNIQLNGEFTVSQGAIFEIITVGCNQ